MRLFLFICFGLGLLLAMVVMTSANGVLHQIAGLIILLGAGIAFAAAALVERLDTIAALLRNAPATGGVDLTHTARSAPGGVVDDANRQTLELAERLAALRKRP
jgi:hypothetical protein